ncbi:MAG: YdcF family protein [Candidatus Pacebacteria bacterium]|jgi:SanA protein|nr:YdcF family protein [Candidatus Paceibacterota bacterium]
MNGKMRKIASATAKVAAIILAAILAADAYVALDGRQGIYGRIDDLPRSQGVLVLGAAVYRDGRLSDVFRDRATVALQIYRAGKVEKILISGDHSVGNYDEVNAGKKFFLQNDVPGEDLFVDYAGFDTYSSIYRAREVFRVESVIIPTQDLYLPRAMFLAERLGVKAYGISADLHEYNLGIKNFLRENAARVKAFGDVATNAKPKFLGPAIPITGDGRDSWD